MRVRIVARSCCVLPSTCRDRAQRLSLYFVCTSKLIAAFDFKGGLELGGDIVAGELVGRFLASSVGI